VAEPVEYSFELQDCERRTGRPAKTRSSVLRTRPATSGRGFRASGAACAAIGVLLCCAPGAAALTACETPSPTIGEVTLKEATMAGVALEAQINPEGSEATYEFLIRQWRARYASEQGEPTPGAMPEQGGRIGATDTYVTVSTFLSGLQPGYTYWYEVVATNLGGEGRSSATPFAYFNPDWNSNGFLPGPVSIAPNRTGCEREYGDIASAIVVREQREIEAAAAAKAKEEAAASRRHAEEPSDVAAGPTESCVVPNLKGDSLRAAKVALSRSHCRLGRVRRPRHHHGALVVTGQRPIHGTKLSTGGSTITLTLGPALKPVGHRPDSVKSQD
jgi:hypothetical protein